MGGLSAHFVRTLSISDHFSVFHLTFVRHVWNIYIINHAKVQNNFFDEHQNCSPFNSVQDALSIKLWGPFFDDSVDIPFFGQGPLSSQIWPSGRELGSQPQAPGSIPPAPLVGSNLCASRQRTLRGLFFAKKSVLKMRNRGLPGF